MLLNYAGSVAYIIMAWTVGLAILKISGLEKAEYKSLPYLSIPVGTTVSAIISALIYLRLGQAVMVIRIAYGILFIAALIFLIYKKTKKQEFISLIVIIGIFLIMSIPGLLKGEKLYVHKGNIYDHYFLFRKLFICVSIRLNTGLIYSQKVHCRMSSSTDFGQLKMTDRRHRCFALY